MATDATAATQKIVSAGMICRSVGCMPAKVIAAAEELGLEPTLIVDDRRYFSAEDAEKIAAALADRR
jgi:hypothetical protein